MLICTEDDTVPDGNDVEFSAYDAVVAKLDVVANEADVLNEAVATDHEVACVELLTNPAGLPVKEVQSAAPPPFIA